MRGTILRIALFTFTVSLLSVLAPKTAGAQCGSYCGSPECGYTCGDLNVSGTVTSADIIELVHLVGWFAYPVYPRECGDVDDYASLNLRDLSWMLERVFQEGPALDCQPDSGTYVPVPNADVLLLFNYVYPAGDTLVRVQVDLFTGRPFHAVSLAIKVSVEDSMAIVSPFATTSSNALSQPVFTAHTIVGDNIHGLGTDVVSGVWAGFGDNDLPPGRYPLAFFDVIMPALPDYRTISLELFGRPDLINDVPMMVDSNMVGWAITPVGRIVDPAGDVNLDRVVTSADIIHLVNYTFKSGTPPQPLPVAGDQNCSGAVNSADVIALVNYVFKGGVEPCDIHTACTIDWQEWTCP